MAVGAIACVILFIIVVWACCSSDNGSSSQNTPKKTNNSPRRYNYSDRDSFDECPSCGAPYFDGYCEECGYPDINQGWLGENH